MLGTPDHAEAPTPIDMESLPDGLHRVMASHGMRLTVFVTQGRLRSVNVHGMESIDRLNVMAAETLVKEKKHYTCEDGHSFSCTNLTVKDDA